MKFFSIANILFCIVFINVSYASNEAVGEALMEDRSEHEVLKNSSRKISSRESIKTTWAPIIMDEIMTFVPATTLPESVPISTEQAYLDVINTARGQEQNCGTEGIKPAVSALSWSNELYNAALQHSNDLAKTNTFSHTGSGTSTDIAAQELHPGTGSSAQERIEHNGYNFWLSYGENLAAGTVMDQAQEAIDAWLSSDGHCANLMNPNFTEVGMAYVYDPNSIYTYYWTQNFGRR